MKSINFTDLDLLKIDRDARRFVHNNYKSIRKTRFAAKFIDGGMGLGNIQHTYQKIRCKCLVDIHINPDKPYNFRSAQELEKIGGAEYVLTSHFHHKFFPIKLNDWLKNCLANWQQF